MTWKKELIELFKQSIKVALASIIIIGVSWAVLLILASLLLPIMEILK